MRGQRKTIQVALVFCRWQEPVFVLNRPGKIQVSWTVQRRKIKAFVCLRNRKREQMDCLVRKQQQNLSAGRQNSLTPPATKSRANNGLSWWKETLQVSGNTELTGFSKLLKTFTDKILLWDYLPVFFQRLGGVYSRNLRVSPARGEAT